MSDKYIEDLIIKLEHVNTAYLGTYLKIIFGNCKDLRSKILSDVEMG